MAKRVLHKKKITYLLSVLTIAPSEGMYNKKELDLNQDQSIKIKSTETINNVIDISQQSTVDTNSLKRTG